MHDSVSATRIGKRLTQPHGLQIRCPHCHESIELAVDASLTDIECSSCGNTFSVADEAVETKAAKTDIKIAHFELIELLGMGGFGTVWKARDTMLDRTVAVKIPRKGQLSGGEAEKFLREARAAAQLKHPNIVSVHEVGRDGDTVFIISDLVSGVALSDWLTSKRMTARKAAELCAKVADALQHAHDAGVIHRDLKPQNIMMDADNQPHLMDFGLARRDVGEVTMTMEGNVLGTPAYMSPEQARGQAHQADGRTDIYSLGVILFELLTGERPFRGNARMLIHQVLHDEAPNPRRLNAGVPKDLETICLKCLEKDPQNRFRTCRELCDEFDRFLRGKPIKARPISSLARTWRWSRRNPAMTGLVGLLLFLGVAGPIVGIRQTRIAKSESEARQTAERLLYVSDMRVALQSWSDGNVDHVVELLRRHVPDEGEDDLRGFEWRYLGHLCQRAFSTPRINNNAPVWALAISPDGKLLATSGQGNTIVIWERPTHRRLRTISGHSSLVHALAFSPDGQMLASGGAEPDQKIRLWRVETGEMVTVLDGHKRTVSCLAYSPDGQTLASASYDHTVGLWDVPSAELVRELIGHEAEVECVAFSPDGRQIVSGGWDRNVMLWDAESATLANAGEHADMVIGVAFSSDGSRFASASRDWRAKVWEAGGATEGLELRGHLGGVYCIAFAPESDVIASGGADNSIRLWDAESGEPKDILRGHSSAVSRIAFSLDGKILASGSFDGTVRLWCVSDQPAPELLKPRMASQNGRVYRDALCVDVSPDGSSVASGGMDGYLRIWDTGTGEETTILAHSNSVADVCFDSRGSILATASWDGKVRIWETSGKLLNELPSHTGRVQAVAFSPDGKMLATGGEDKTVRLWDVDTYKCLFELEGNADWVNSLEFSEDGQLLASAGDDGLIRLWSTDTKKIVRTFSGHDGWVTGLDFSPKGLLASAGFDGTVKIWDVQKTTAPVTLTGHASGVFDVAFSSTGETLASASADYSVRLWDVSSGEERGTLIGHTDDVNAVVFSSNDKLLASASDDGTVRLWRAAREKDVERLLSE